MSDKPSGPMLDVSDVARIFRADPKTVNRWTHKGMLKCVFSPGGHRRFYATDVIELLLRLGWHVPEWLTFAVERERQDEVLSSRAGD